MAYKVYSFGSTDIGLIRQKNEDVWAELSEEKIFILADGMGGHKAGDVAAKEAVDALCLLIKEGFSGRSLSLKDAKDFFENAFYQVNDIVHHMGLENSELKGMGTTLCCLHFHEQGVVFANVGDSRIYRLREDKLDQITKDHSLLRDLVDLGRLQGEQQKGFAYKHIITMAIGTEPEVDPSVHIADVQDSDVYLLCSDGLSDILEHEEIRKTIINARSIEDAAHNLIDLAIRKGGHDNVTVLIVHVQSLPENATRQ